MVLRGLAIVCLLLGSATACPAPDVTAVVGGARDQFDSGLVGVLPPNPVVYVHIGRDETKVPRFFRHDGAAIPVTVTPMKSSFFAARVELHVSSGAIVERTSGRQWIIDPWYRPTTRHVGRGEYFEELELDSDARVFRIEHGNGLSDVVPYFMLPLNAHMHRLVVMYADGREETFDVRPGSETPWPERSVLPVAMLGLLVWLSRRRIDAPS
jgi:hypothetical protein